MEFAKKTGSSRLGISQIECGRRLPSLPKLSKIAEALGVKTSWLFILMEEETN